MSDLPATRPADDAVSARPARGDVVTLLLDGWAHGGEAVGRLPGGMACFVGYAIPGERVNVEITVSKKRWARGRLLEVLDPSPHRVQPPCPHFGPTRCGGCQLQHIAPEHQLELKGRVLREQLQRLGEVADPPVGPVQAVPGGWPDAYRAWARMAVAPDGSLGFRSPGSHRVHPVDHCLLLSEGAAAARDAVGDGWDGCAEVEVMAGSDGVLALLHPDDPDALPGITPPVTDRLPAAASGLPLGVAVQGTQRAPVPLRPPPSVSVQVGGETLQVSAGAFFQPGPAAALALATTVVGAAGLGLGDHVLDLYAGGGLLSRFLGATGARVTAVESDPVAVADAERNLHLPGHRLIAGDVTRVLAQLLAAPDGPANAHPDVVVLDPPRAGAGEQVCRQVLALLPRRIVYVACDAAALGRDTRTLIDGGYDLSSVVGLDAFGHTAHVEAVATFDRPSGQPRG